MTAGSIVAAARFYHQPTAPWDELPEDHFVASCSYSDPKAVATSPETICPNGDGVLLYKPTKLFADEDGRTSPDYVFDSTSPAWC
jgi:hypothetical protein